MADAMPGNVDRADRPAKSSDFVIASRLLFGLIARTFVVSARPVHSRAGLLEKSGKSGRSSIPFRTCTISGLTHCHYLSEVVEAHLDNKKAKNDEES